MQRIEWRQQNTPRFCTHFFPFYKVNFNLQANFYRICITNKPCYMCSSLGSLHTTNNIALQMHCTENSKQKLPEKKLRGLVPNFYIHIYVSDLYIPRIGQQTQYSKISGPIVGIYTRKSLTVTVHECRNWERGRAVSFLGIFVSNLRCSVDLKYFPCT
jgi:hypothetical protein